MLVLTRKIDESIYIGDHIKVTVLEIDSRGQVRVGLDVPKHIPVHREEIYRKIRSDQNSMGQAG